MDTKGRICACSFEGLKDKGISMIGVGDIEASGAAMGVSWGYKGVIVGMAAEDICDDMEGMNSRRGTWFPPCCR